MTDPLEPPFLGLDAELFMFMLERHAGEPGLATSVAAIQTRLSCRAKRNITVEEVEGIVESTQYRQRSKHEPAVDNTPYLTTHVAGNLSHLRLLEGVAENSSRWGWNA